MHARIADAARGIRNADRLYHHRIRYPERKANHGVALFVRGAIFERREICCEPAHLHALGTIL